MNDVLFNCLGDTYIVGVTGNLYFSNSEDPNKLQQIERIQSEYRIAVKYVKERNMAITSLNQ